MEKTADIDQVYDSAATLSYMLGQKKDHADKQQTTAALVLHTVAKF